MKLWVIQGYANGIISFFLYDESISHCIGGKMIPTLVLVDIVLAQFCCCYWDSAIQDCSNTLRTVVFSGYIYAQQWDCWITQ